MAVDLIESAMQAVASHFATTDVVYLGASTTLDSRVGWPEKDVKFDFAVGPVLTVTSLGAQRVYHSPHLLRDGPPPILWKIADVTISAQLDLWAPHRGVRDDAARAVELKWHSRMPQTPGLFLTQPDYFDRPLHLLHTEGRNLDDGLDASMGEWRRMWEVSIDASECVETSTPQQLAYILRLTQGASTPQDFLIP